MHVLLVEDDTETSAFVAKSLRENGYVVDSAVDGRAGLEMAVTGQFDLAVLDVRLPGLDGFEMLRRMRAVGVRTPVLFLSAEGDVQHRIEGLNLGADDYLTKPFALAELLARIRAVYRRGGSEMETETLTLADLKVDRAARSAWRGPTRIELTQREYELLEYLLRHVGHVLSRGMITENVWGYGFDSFSNVIDVHINNLRKKLDRDFEPRLIHTVKGVGYILEDRS